MLLGCHVIDDDLDFPPPPPPPPPFLPLSLLPLLPPPLLQVLFTQFQHSDQSSLPPDILRRAMAACYEVSLFINQTITVHS